MTLTALLTGLLVVFMLAGCGQPEQPAPATETESASREAPADRPPARPPAWYRMEQAARGGQLYARYCAECHGAGAEGAPDWRNRNPEGKFPPPPLNGTGHAWHHPLGALFHSIMNGSPGGQGNMPAWNGKLDREEVVSIIAWFQSRWPDEIYGIWYRREQEIQQQAADRQGS